MRRFSPLLWICLLACLLSWKAFADSPEQTGSGRKVFVIPVNGTVDPGMAAFIERAVQAAQNEPEALYVLEMDTFGGRVDSALRIVDILVNVPKGQTVAFVSKKAISAGALISLACGQLAMRPNTTIGDCAPILYSNEGPKMMGEKFQSPLRAKFRALAKRNGYPQPLAEAMVTADMVVYELEAGDGKRRYLDARAYQDLSQAQKDAFISKKTVVAEGELLTMDDVEARQLGFSKMTVSDIPAMLEKMGIRDYQRLRIEESWSETLVRMITAIAPVLMMIGLAALYTELQAPGFGVPGIVGILCLTLVFGGQYLVGLADHTELLILLLGVVLMGFELFVIPGFGIAGIAGMVCIALGMVLALQNFVLPDPELPWQRELLFANLFKVFFAIIGAFIASLLFMRYIFPRLSVVVSGPYLAADLKGSHAWEADAIGLQKGDRGVAATYLRPSGKMQTGTEVFDVITEGEFIEKGAAIKVHDIRGNRIIVAREIEAKP